LGTETYHQNKTFSINYAEKELAGREFDKCTFQQVDFSNCIIRNSIFSDCVMETCNLTMAQLINTGFSGVKFKNCKMLGIDFNPVRDLSFSVSFDNCILDYASFSRKKLRNTIFKKCRMMEVNFQETDLTGSIFPDCDLTRTLFNNTILNDADFTSAYNFSIDPENNKVKKAKFSASGL
jgi:fluoroquinolone resistance protein